MIDEFLSRRQNFKDTLTMIGESRKRENEDLGYAIVKVAEELRAKREKEKS